MNKKEFITCCFEIAEGENARPEEFNNEIKEDDRRLPFTYQEVSDELFKFSELAYALEELNVETILQYADEDELFCLFGEFLNRMQEKMKDSGVFSVEHGEAVFLDKDKINVIKEMKKQ